MDCAEKFKMLLLTILLLCSFDAFADINANEELAKTAAHDTHSSDYSSGTSKTSNIKSRNWGLSISTGYGTANIVPIRIGIQKYWDKSWHNEKSWGPKGYWELSYCAMKGKRGPLPGSNNSDQVYAFAGVLRVSRNEPIGNHIWPYFDFGLGAARFNKKEIGGRNLGSHFQFEDRLGFGCRFGEFQQFELGYRFLHYSNAGLAMHNDGINLQMIVFSYWF